MDNFRKNMEVIKSFPLDKIPDDLKETERMKIIVDRNGTHNKGFLEYFGYNMYFSIGEIVTKASEKRDRKKKLAHYYFHKDSGERKDTLRSGK